MFVWGAVLFSFERKAAKGQVDMEEGKMRRTGIHDVKYTKNQTKWKDKRRNSHERRNISLPWLLILCPSLGKSQFCDVL